MARAFKTLVELYEQSIRNYANNPLFGVKKKGDYEWSSYKTFSRKVTQLRDGLAQLGVGKGDTVAIIADNRTEWAVVAYAVYCRGAALCPMYESQPESDWEYITTDSGAKLLFVASQEIHGQVAGFAQGEGALERVIFFDGDEAHEDSLQGLLQQGKDNPGELVHPEPEDLAGFIYTSGTTGKPKGVLLTHQNICFNVSGVLSLEIIKSSDVSLAFLPWAHSFGQNCELHVMVAQGASMGLINDVSTLMEDMAAVRPTVLFAVPRIFNKIYEGLNKKMREEPPIKQKLFELAMANSKRLRELREDNETSLPSTLLDRGFDRLIFEKVRERFGGRLRLCISGGAALSPKVATFIDNLHIDVFEGYGLTETSPLISVNIPGARKIGSVGRPMPGVKVTIKDVEGYDEGIGEICVRGKNVMEGYHGLPEKTAEVLDEGGELFHTGDLGSLDEDGFLWILGRVKEQYKLENGKYVVPAPIEEQLALSPYITQCMIEGTNKPHNVAVIVVDRKELEAWGGEQGVPKDELLTHKKVRELIASEIKKAGSEVKSYERPKDFILTDEEWTTENGMLTPKMSLKRREVMKKYGDELEKLF